MYLAEARKKYREHSEGMKKELEKELNQHGYAQEVGISIEPVDLKNVEINFYIDDEKVEGDYAVDIYIRTLEADYWFNCIKYHEMFKLILKEYNNDLEEWEKNYLYDLKQKFLYDLKQKFLNEDKRYSVLDTIYTFTEAAEKWGLSDGAVLRNAVRRGYFKEGEYRQSGSTWLITKSAMERVYGKFEGI